MMSTCREAEIKIDLKRVLFTVAAARDTEATLFIPNLSDDLFVLFSAQHAKSNHIRTILQSLTELGGSSAINGTNSGCLLLLADEFTREVVWGAACQLPGWRVFGCFVPFWGPPCGDQELTVSAASCHQAGAGLLESVALGVALGTVKQLPLLFTDSVYVVPLDLGVSAAVVFVSLCLRKVSSLLFPATGVVLEVLPNGDGLVWGMFSKYLLDYYSCVRHKEGEVFPVQWMLDASPILHLEVRARDWLTYGVSPKILKSFYGSAAIKRRDQLTKYRPDSSVGIKINEVVKDIDARVRDLVQVTRRFGSVSSRGICSPPGCREHVQKTTFVMDYASFLKEVALDASLRPLHALISLSSVKWDIYVKATAYATLERTARQFGERKCQLPLPVPHFHNDIVFHGAQSAPLNGRFTHGYIGNIQWAFWCGMQPNGQRVKTAPGLTRSAVTHILEQPIVIRAIEEETQSTEGGHIESVRARAATLLRGIGDSMNQFHIRALGVIVRRTLFKLYDEVFVNDEAFGRLYKAANTPRVLVVLLPAHRSYMDFIIVTYLLIVMGIPPPHICAGDDFTRLGAVTKFMRGSGAFFMRRSFRNDRLYYALFREYVRHLVRQRHTLEFFIEGTRSRTGKAQRPMLGLLKFVIEAAHDARDVIDDVQIFPISLSYDELLEAKLYADEQLGVPKPKENIKNLLHARSLLDRKRGKNSLARCEAAFAAVLPRQTQSVSNTI
ncbi:putative Acyltransferase [Trypanosoma vivax]|nr:putative Acyltransferase [Trypanosoma vivax]